MVTSGLTVFTGRNSTFSLMSLLSVCYNSTIYSSLVLEALLIRELSTGLMCLAFASGGLAQQNTNNGSPLASPLIQVEHLAGDQYTGFTQSCLLVLGDGRYHREARRQVHSPIGSRPSPDWRISEVFESALNAGELEKLKAITGNTNFRAIVGTFGDPADLHSKLALWPGGAGATPHSDIDIFEVAVAHTDELQVFRLFKPIGTESASSVRPFENWVGMIEQRRDGRIANATGDFCAPGSASSKSPSQEPPVLQGPTPISTPGPDCPGDKQAEGSEVHVGMHFMINPDGSVGAVSIRGELTPEFEHCLLESVKHWTFAPARLYGLSIAWPFNVDLKLPIAKVSPK